MFCLLSAKGRAGQIIFEDPVTFLRNISWSFPVGCCVVFQKSGKETKSAFMSYSNLVAAKRARDSDSQIILRAWSDLRILKKNCQQFIWNKDHRVLFLLQFARPLCLNSVLTRRAFSSENLDQNFRAH